MINVLAEAVKRIKSVVHRKPSAKLSEPARKYKEIKTPRSFLYYLKPGSTYRNIFAEIKDPVLLENEWQFEIISGTISTEINDLNINKTYVIQIENDSRDDYILEVKAVKVEDTEDTYKVCLYGDV